MFHKCTEYVKHLNIWNFWRRSSLKRPLSTSCPYITAAIWIILPHFSWKARQQRLRSAVCLENLNMTEKMSCNPGLTCAVRWKSCSDCKAAWVSIRLLHCLSVTWDKLPKTVRAPVYQVHYNNTAESDYRWQLGAGKHVLGCTAVALNSILPFICLEISRGRTLVPFGSTAATLGRRCEGLRRLSSSK